MVMKPVCLTASLVEELQQLVTSGRDVEPVVGLLTSATLPGVMEYGVLRSTIQGIPDLPLAIRSSAIGRALEMVRTPLGLRNTGQQRQPPRSMTASEFEFFVLEGRDPQQTQDWNEFLLRYRQSAAAVGFEMRQATQLGAALHEMADNAVNHSEATDGILVGYHAIRGKAICCVADIGIGILASLTQCAAYSYLTTHRDAVRLALQNGVSRHGPNQGGLGLNQVFKSLAAAYGTLRFRSGQGCVTMDGRDLDCDQGEESFVSERAGFQVTICCRLNNQPDSAQLI
jgi:anti-sigma regulatory factor (Ser/Thr protein kinase)